MKYSESKPGIVGIIGIGLVGTALAENLLRGGYDVYGYDIEPSRVEYLEGLGGHGGSSAAEIASVSERVLLSLMTSTIVEEVLFGPDGLLGRPARIRCIIDTSTGDPAYSQRFASEAERRGVTYLDATVSGSSEQIRRREGVFMVGGDPAAFRANGALFDALAQRSVHVGPPGSGARAKLASNLVLGLNRAALAEGLVFAEAIGLDLPGFLDLLKMTPAYSGAMDVKGAKMIARDFIPQSKVSQHRKDLETILSIAEKRGIDLPLAAIHEKLLAHLVHDHKGELDTSAIIEAIRGRTGESST